MTATKAFRCKVTYYRILADSSDRVENEIGNDQDVIMEEDEDEDESDERVPEVVKHFSFEESRLI